MCISSFNKNDISPDYCVAYTGPDISLLSGIQIYKNEHLGYELNHVLTTNFFYDNTFIFYKVYRELLKIRYSNPNFIHTALQHLSFEIITESFDGLHYKAGSSNTIELNGNLDYLECTKCSYKIHSEEAILSVYSEEQLRSSILCPMCGSILKPTLVLIGDPVNNLHLALNKIYKAKSLYLIGNNLTYRHSRLLVKRAQSSNCKIIYINEKYEDALYKMMTHS